MAKIQIEEKDYKKLLRAATKLDALEAGGVDNWEWYSASLEGWYKETGREDLYEDFVNEVDEILVDGVDYDFPAGWDAGISITINSWGEERLVEILKKYSQRIIDLENGD